MLPIFLILSEYPLSRPQIETVPAQSHGDKFSMKGLRPLMLLHTGFIFGYGVYHYQTRQERQLSPKDEPIIPAYQSMKLFSVWQVRVQWEYTPAAWGSHYIHPGRNVPFVVLGGSQSKCVQTPGAP